MALLCNWACASFRPVVIRRMPQLMSVPIAAGITKSGDVATTEPTGAIEPGWKSGVAQALQTLPWPFGSATEAKSSNWLTALCSSGRLSGSKMVAAACSLWI